MRSLKIQPKEVTYVRHISRIDVKNGRVVLNESAEFEVWMFSPEDDLISIESISITGDEYAAWTDDDDYVYGLILQKLGMSTLSEPEAPAGDSESPAQ